MLDLSSSNLWTEIKAAESFRDKHLGRVEELIERYAGSSYREDFTAGAWNENHMFEFIRLTTARIIFDNPKVRVKTRRPGTQRDVAKAMKHAQDRWVRDVNLRRLLKRIYTDMCFCYGSR